MTLPELIVDNGKADRNFRDLDQRLTAAEGSSTSPINVKNRPYYATGDGSTDDTAAIQAALDATSGDTVLFPEGTYRVTALTITSGTHLILAAGATIKRTGASGSLLSTAAAVSDVSIVGGTLDNNASTSDIFTSAYNANTDVTFGGVTFDNYTSATPRAITIGASGDGLNERIRINGCWFYGDDTADNAASVSITNGAETWVSQSYFTGGGVTINTSTSLTSDARGIFILNNRLENIIASGILVRPHGNTVYEDVVIEGNSATSVGWDGSTYTTTKGLVVVGESTSAGSNMLRRCRISNNSIRYFGGAAITVGGGTGVGRAQDVTISDNIMDAAEIGGSSITDDWPTNNAGINMENVNGFTVTGNRIRRVGRGGIRLIGTGSDATYYCRNGTISGNTIHEAAYKTDNTSPATDLECGITVWYYCEDITITGNVVTDTGAASGGGTAQAGIGIGPSSTGVTNIVVTGNRCTDSRGVTPYGIRVGYAGMSDANGPTNVTISGNHLEGNATGGVTVAGTISSDHGHSIFQNPGAGTNEQNRILMGAVTWDPGNLVVGASTSTTTTIYGASVGDLCVASFTGTLSGLQLWAEITATDTATVYLYNATAGAVDLASATARVLVFRGVA